MSRNQGGCTRGHVANKSKVVQFFKGQVLNSHMAKQTRGVGLDECLLNNAVCPEEGDLAADGFRAAKKAMPQ